MSRPSLENGPTCWGSRWSGNPFPAGDDAKGQPYNDLRWSVFKNFATPRRCSGSSPSRSSRSSRTHARRGLDLRPLHEGRAASRSRTPACCCGWSIVLDKIPMEDRDTKGDIYEYMLAKIASAGQNGQFRTPRHIIELMVEMTAPQPTRHHLSTRHAARAGSWWRRRSTCVRTTRTRSTPARASASTSTTRCSTASTSTTRCCASAR